MMTYTEAEQALIVQKSKIQNGVPGDWRRLFQVALSMHRRVKRLEADLALYKELHRASVSR